MRSLERIFRKFWGMFLLIFLFEEKQDKLPYRIRRLVNIITDSQSSLSRKALSLQRLQVVLMRIKRRHPKKYEKIWTLLPLLIKSMLNNLNSAISIQRPDGYWESRDQICWIPFDDSIPRNKDDSNIDELSWRDIKKKWGFTEIRFQNGFPRFKEISKLKRPDIIKKHLKCSIENVPWEQLIGNDEILLLKKTGNAHNLNEAVYKYLAMKNNCTVDEVKKIVNSNRLVLHEDPNCKTIKLVPQEIHGNIPHIGGVEMLKILSSVIHFRRDLS